MANIGEDGEPSEWADLVPTTDVHAIRSASGTQEVACPPNGRQGVETGRLGNWLTALVRERGSDLCVYYDHGDKSTGDRICEPKGFIGTSVTNANRIKGIDLLVATSGGVARVLVEIEERPVSPSKVIGDAWAILMSTGFAVLDGRHQRYVRPDAHTVLIVAGVVPDGGDRLEKIKLIEDRIQQGTGYPFCVLAGNVELIFESQLPTTLARVQDRLRELTG